MLRLVKSSVRPGRERVDRIALLVAAVATLLVVGAVVVAINLANVPPPPPPTLTPRPTLSSAELSATPAELATITANQQRMALTLAAVMQVTPAALATGIGPQGLAPAWSGAADFITQNVWVGLVGDEWASVYAGALRSDPQTGALWLVTVRSDRVDRQRFTAALSQGALQVTTANYERLVLDSAGGQTYYFDVLAERFVGSLTEYAETAAPPSTTATAAATPGITPAVTLTPTP